MDFMHIIEVVATIGVTLVAMYGRDRANRATTKQRVEIIESMVKDLKGEISKLDETLSKTNQFLSSTHATVKGLASWLERTENRLNNL